MTLLESPVPLPQVSYHKNEGSNIAPLTSTRSWRRREELEWRTETAVVITYTSKPHLNVPQPEFKTERR
jgi:hypothetical protein